MENKIWEALPFACVFSDNLGIVTDINSAGEVILNIAKKKILMKPIQQYLRVDFELTSYFNNFSKSDNKFSLKNINMTVNGNVMVVDFWIIKLTSGFLFVVQPIRNNNLNNIFFAETASQSVVSMAQMLTHEIKNPIAGIVSAAQLLEMSLSKEDRKLTKLITDETTRILDLVEQFDHFGDLRKPKSKSLNIHNIIQRAITSSKVKALNSIIIEEDYDPSLPDVIGDPIQLEQVFSNLMDNSINALDGYQNGKIIFKTYFEKGLYLKANDGVKRELPLHIQVKDNGCGIPEKLSEKIFEPFITGSKNGTGLGLSLVSKIIMLHNGVIKASSENNLTIFKISLPVLS